MMKDCMGVIYTGENNLRLRDLTFERSVAALPVGGRYRVVDFTLSNMVNAGISTVGIITQRNYQSLLDHIGSGKEWDMNRKKGGLLLLPPFVGKGDTGFYQGLLDALHGLRGYIHRINKKYLVISTCHNVYNADLSAMLDTHIANNADVTVLYSSRPAYNGTEPQPGEERAWLAVDQSGRVTDVQVNPIDPGSHFRSLECYIIDRATAEYLVEENVSRGRYSLTREVLLGKKDSLRIFGHPFDGYVGYMDSIDSYYQTNMDLLDAQVAKSVYRGEGGAVYTKVKDQAPTLYGENAVCKNSLVADGCVIEGTVENSILFRGAYVGPGAVVKDSVVMEGCFIMKNALADRVILDKKVTMKQHRQLVGQPDYPVVVGKGEVI